MIIKPETRRGGAGRSFSCASELGVYIYVCSVGRQGEGEGEEIEDVDVGVGVAEPLIGR